MTFKVVEDGARATVFLAGEVDLESSPAAREALLGVLKKGRALAVDLSAVRYMDSSGVASLVEALQQARERKLDFSLVQVSEPVRKLLRLARLDKVFTIK